MTKKLTLSIPKPCHEDWDKMTCAEKGRFCGSCRKEVIDFTRMSESQLIAFFKKPTGSVCGRFRNDQLEKDIYIRPRRMPWVKYFFQIALPVFLFSCKQKTIGKVKMETVKDPALNSVSVVMGRPVPPLTGDVKSSVNITKGETLPEFVETENVIVGDVLFNETEEINNRATDTIVSWVQLPEVIVEEGKIMCTKTISDSAVLIMGAVMAGVRVENIYDNMENNKRLPEAGGVYIYPNPVLRNSTAKADASNLPAGNYKLELADMGGRILYLKELTVDKFALVEIPMSGLPGGMYVVRFQNKLSGKTYTEKIIVQ
jgi:hypothetical protein